MLIEEDFNELKRIAINIATKLLSNHNLLNRDEYEVKLCNLHLKVNILEYYLKDDFDVDDEDVEDYDNNFNAKVINSYEFSLSKRLYNFLKNDEDLVNVLNYYITSFVLINAVSNKNTHLIKNSFYSSNRAIAYKKKIIAINILNSYKSEECEEVSNTTSFKI